MTGKTIVWMEVMKALRNIWVVTGILIPQSPVDPASLLGEKDISGVQLTRLFVSLRISQRRLKLGRVAESVRRTYLSGDVTAGPV